MVSEPSILSTVGNASENSITTQLDLQRWATEQHEWHERQMENLNLMLQKFGSSVTDLRQNQLCSEDSIEQTVSADFQKLASPSPKQQRRRVRRFPAQRPHRKIRAGKPTKRSGFPSKTARSSVRASRLPELGKLRVHVPLIGSQIRTHDLLIRCVNDVTSILGFCTDGNGDVDPGRPNHVWKPGGLLCVKAHRDGLRRVSSGGRVMKLVDSGFQVDPSEASNSKYGGLVYDIGKKKLGMEEAGAKMEMDAKKSKKLDCSLIALNPQGCFCWEGVGTRIIGDHCKCTSKENANRESLDHEDVGLRSDYKDFLLLNLTFTACVLKGAPEARLGARLTKAQPLSPSIAGARLCPKGSLERAPCHGASLSLRRASAEKCTKGSRGSAPRLKAQAQDLGASVRLTLFKTQFTAFRECETNFWKQQIEGQKMQCERSVGKMQIEGQKMQTNRVLFHVASYIKLSRAGKSLRVGIDKLGGSLIRSSISIALFKEISYAASLLNNNHKHSDIKSGSRFKVIKFSAIVVLELVNGRNSMSLHKRPYADKWPKQIICTNDNKVDFELKEDSIKKKI